MKQQNGLPKKSYTFWNNLMGWAAFLITAITYILTIEPTTSFWDCGEFITTAYKLEVGHPPGAPLFMIMGRVFSLFSFGDVTKVAVMINIMSALASAFTIMFLFWTITHIARKLIVKTEMTEGKMIAILGSGLVGALAYAFSDSFWFSAVEGEVYATSSLFTAVVFWAILKWENVADEKYSNRWLILIAYLVGLSIGIHLLNLLAIPSIVFVYYFKKYKTTRNGIIYASLASIAILGGVMYGIIPGIISIASKFELIFTNGMGLPFNTGIFIYALLIIAGLVFGIYYTHKNKKVVLNTILLSVTVIIIGYSSFAMIVVRSLANPPMDQNSPDNIFSMLSYLNREQYGDRPLFKGQYYNSESTGYKKGASVYAQIDGKYKAIDQKFSPEFNKKQTTIFPRMYSSQAALNHPAGYKKWAGIAPNDKRIPSFGHNLKFFFRYQLGHMYFRYLMWNFAGRQDDIQGHGDTQHGNWISGINFIDELFLGNQDKITDQAKNNKGRNKYYLLPLILGLAGLVYLAQRNKKDFTVVLMLFFFTGIAIVLYTNQPPYQPRERDYAYAGSFYAFAIFIGLGVLALYEALQNALKDSKTSSAIATVVCLLAVPTIMATENWDDHSRAERYTARDLAHNYLNSCAKNAILFTNGDNDTFPLWYAQEVEGIRTDVRVVNLSYLATDWYIDQMKRRSYLSAPVPFSLTHDKYIQGQNEAVYIQERIKEPYDLKELINFVANNDPKTKLQNRDGSSVSYFPTKKFTIPVDAEKIMNKKIIPSSWADRIVPKIEANFSGEYIRKNKLMVLDLLANNNWERPIYFAITVGRSNYMNLQNYFQLEGLAYRVVPVKKQGKDGQTGFVNADIMYDNMMNKFKWGGIDNPNVYLDENNQRMIMNLRNNFARLAKQLLKEGKKEKAIKVLDRSMEIMPHERVPYNYYSLLIAEAYYFAQEYEKANNIALKLADVTINNLNYYVSLDQRQQMKLQQDIEREGAIFKEIMRYVEKNQQKETLKKINEKYNQFLMQNNIGN